MSGVLGQPRRPSGHLMGRRNHLYSAFGNVDLILFSGGNIKATYTGATTAQLDRGAALVTALAAQSAGDTLFVGPHTFEGIATFHLISGGNLRGCGASASKVLTLTNGVENFYCDAGSGTATVRDLYFNGVTNEPFLVQSGATAVCMYNTYDSGGGTFWMNGNTPNATVYDSVLNGGILSAGTGVFVNCTVSALSNADTIVCGSVTSTLTTYNCTISHPGTGNKSCVDPTRHSGQTHTFSFNGGTISLASGTGSAVKQLTGISGTIIIGLTDVVVTGSPNAAGLGVTCVIAGTTVTMTRGSSMGAGLYDLKQSLGTMNVSNATTFATQNGTISFF